MKYLCENLKINIDDDLYNVIKNKYKLNDFNYKILHKSIDARNKNDIKLVYKLMIETNKYIKQLKKYEEKNINITYPNWNDKSPIIVGFGPAGMFSALYLARCNAKPIIIERGKKVEDRINDINKFINNRILNENSNTLFGEGGAGTFSDGKLNTNNKDKLNNFILNELYKAGAKENILYDAKPHIGSDILINVVRNIRNEIIKLGGIFYFDTTFINYEINGSLIAYLKNDKVFNIKTNHLILAIGHSARDTYRMLYNKGINMIQKQFSMGVRIEHKREDINKAQYGQFYDKLPTAYYKLSTHNNDRGIYTFCMCPGGYVIPSVSSDGYLCVNGMSNNDRMNENSNSAILVDVKPSDYNHGNVLDGIKYQEYYESKAFNISKDYKAPITLVKEFLNDEIPSSIRSITPSYKLGYKFANLYDILPNFVCDNLKYGILEFDKQLKGFNNPDSPLIGIEARSSSPIRIIRDDNFKTNDYIYPVGEGAGYAGGIMTAAVDGLKCAIKIAGGSYEN